jgi:hypothetical protein
MLHQTRLSLSASGATRRLPSPQGWARRVLNDGMVHIPVVSTRGKLAPPLCSGVEGVGWLCSPHSRQALSGMRCVLIRSYSLANTHQWIEDAGQCHFIACRWKRRRPPSQSGHRWQCRAPAVLGHLESKLNLYYEQTKPPAEHQCLPASTPASQSGRPARRATATCPTHTWPAPENKWPPRSTCMRHAHKRHE